ncbi:uncharacterized protein LOC126670437 [Mercurialis annua]|uniref:uncharacterized protein LOC126670437 n=1 Tax=Mercurialis annua TaxID=3986 RepID=UPI00215FB6F7|nr:uncharacterized protein LOC126670437 [Mercurialis annua]
MDNHTHSELGKIWIMFDSLKVDVQKVDSNDQMIHCKVDMEGFSFYWTVIYGSNHLVDRKCLWHKLIDLSRKTTGAWYVQGDFNAVLTNEDRCGGCPLDEDHSYELSNCIFTAGISELKSIGCHFTWNNNQLGENIIWRRLDRVFGNGDACAAFQRVYFEALACGVSDHSPFITILQNDQESGFRGFKFNNFWTLHPEFNNIIDEECRVEYRGFMINSILIDEERAMANHFRFLLSCEESFYKQKSRIQRLNLGDSSSKFFNNLIKIRRMVNCIPSLKLNDGRVISSNK